MSRVLSKTAIFLSVILFSIVVLPARVFSQEGQASIYLSPAQGTFEVGSTFDVSFFVNTAGDDVNAVRLDATFPPEMLQIADPAVGVSFVEIWVSQPEYSNTNGTLALQGGLPSPGINTSAGLITTVTFRAKSPGTAVIKVLSSSSILANDGKGTDVLATYGSGTYQITTPPPEGPMIVSNTHPDQGKWYRDNNPDFSWEIDSLPEYLEEDVSIEYSWILDESPLGVPDNEVDGDENSTSYENVESGMSYFHVKARVDGKWGKTSHYLVKIDSVKPAEFSPEMDQLSAPSDIRRFVTFITTDAHSGVSHYEVRIESLDDTSAEGSFFTEEISPYQLPSLTDGRYKLIVRAHDTAGNVQDGELEFWVRTSLISFTERGVRIGSIEISWWIAIPFLLLILVLLVLLVRYLKRQFGDPSDQVAGYLTGVRRRVSNRKQKIESLDREEKEIQEVIENELKEISGEVEKKSTASEQNRSRSVGNQDSGNLKQTKPELSDSSYSNEQG